jgi:4-amino-4-deoxy-L-arabinose transferase-like glycosyltransferase
MNHSSYYAVDTPSYMVPADNLLQRHEFVNELYQPELTRTPGYPLLLALFRINPLKVEYLILLQHVLCVLTVVALAGAALRVTDSSLIALASASVLSLDLATLVVANVLLTEIVFTVFVAFASWMLYQVAKEATGTIARTAAAGLMGGCAVLIRPVGLLYFVPVSIYLCLVLKRRAIRPILVFTASFLLFPLAWCTRNYVESGYFGISTITGDDLLAYKAAGALAVRQPGDYLTNVLKSQSVLQEQACQGMLRTYGRDCAQVSEAQRAEYSARMGIDIIIRNIPGYLQSALVGLGYILFGGGTEALSQMGRLNLHLAKRIVLLITIPEAGLAVVGCWFWFRRERTLCYLLVLTVVYFLLISAGAEAYSRFRVPVMPMYALLVGAGIAATIQWVQRIWAAGTARVAAYKSVGSINGCIRSCS